MGPPYMKSSTVIINHVLIHLTSKANVYVVNIVCIKHLQTAPANNCFPTRKKKQTERNARSNKQKPNIYETIASGEWLH